MLEEHLGKAAGKFLAVTYIFVFFLLTILYLRFFEEFVSNNVLLATPVSVLLMIILIPGFYAIRSGIQVIAQVSEVLLIIFLPLVIITLIAGFTDQPDIGNLLPISDINIKSLLYSIYLNTWHFANMIIIMALFTFTRSNVKSLRNVLIKTAVVLVVILTFSATVIILVLGADLAFVETFPLSEIGRNVQIGGFIRNTEAIFISSFIMGIFISVIMFWFMTCYSIQQVFNLKDYRFLAAPTAIIIGFGAVMVSPNTFATFLILKNAAPLIFDIFFAVIPVLLYIWVLVKSRFSQSSTPGM
jgi:spore germination protein KB